MGILNRTPDSFYDRGATFELDALLRRADGARPRGRRPPRRRRGEGGARARGVARPRSSTGWSRRSTRCTSASTSPSRATPGGRACSTPRAAPARSSATTSAASATPTTSRVAAKHDASVVATHIRLRPRVRRSRPALRRPGRRRHRVPARPGRAAPRPRGWHAEQIALDAGLDLGKTPAQSAVLLRESASLAAHGYALLLSASNKRYLGDLLELDIERPARRVAGVGRVRRGARVPHRAGARRRRLGRRVPRDRGDPPGGAPVTTALYFVQGDDPMLRDRALDALVDELLGDDDRTSRSRSSRCRPRRAGAATARRTAPRAAPTRAKRWSGPPLSAAAEPAVHDRVPGDRAARRRHARRRRRRAGGALPRRPARDDPAGARRRRRRRACRPASPRC